MNLIELTHKNDILQTYEIYKHCMFMPTEEKFNKKVEQFLNNTNEKRTFPRGTCRKDIRYKTGRVSVGNRRNDSEYRYSQTPIQIV